MIRNSKGKFDKNTNNGNEDLKTIIKRPKSSEEPTIINIGDLGSRRMNTSYLLFGAGLIVLSIIFPRCVVYNCPRQL